jgi:mannose-1-phosphate guanylyltransferase
LKTSAVIIAGGSGTRLWPLSRAQHPKQFLPIHGKKTLLQQTIERVKFLDIDSIIVICNEEHRFLAAEQLNEINALCPIILEPQVKNTAPAIALAALHCEEDSMLFILPSDHFIEDNNSLKKSYNDALSIAKDDKLVTFGIHPNYPHTGYGYIKKGSDYKKGFLVDKFYEKPSSNDAVKYIESGNCLWNSGIFLFKAKKYLAELKEYREDIYEVCKSSFQNISTDFDFIRVDKEVFSSCPAESIDYAVMEKTKDAAVIPMHAGWSDIGSWASLSEISNQDKNKNVKNGDIITINTNDSFIYSDSQLVGTIGINNLIIVVTKDAILVASKESSEEIKELTSKLKESSRPELDNHREVYRPWGKYDSVDVGDSFQVKRITVKPGEKLSVQKHHHRSEHWVVVSGVAIVTRDKENFKMSKNESTYIPLGSIHSLENPGPETLELIEVQTGDYLGEDDIVRFEDKYNRDEQK